MARKPIIAGRKSIKVTIMASKVCANMKLKGFRMIPLPPFDLLRQLEIINSKLTAHTIETRNISIAIWFWLIHRGGGGWRRLILRGGAARREQQHQRHGEKKGACRDVVHLSLPDSAFFWKFTLLIKTAAMSMLDCRHHPDKSVRLYTTDPASNLDAWLSV